MKSAEVKQKFSLNLKVKLEGCPNSNSLPIITKSNGHLVAMLADRNEANAHLFAAAPDLFEALRYAVREIEEFYAAAGRGELGGVTIELGQFRRLVTIKQAIAKAEGR